MSVARIKIVLFMEYDLEVGNEFILRGAGIIGDKLNVIPPRGKGTASLEAIIGEKVKELTIHYSILVINGIVFPIISNDDANTIVIPVMEFNDTITTISAKLFDKFSPPTPITYLGDQQSLISKRTVSLYLVDV